MNRALFGANAIIDALLLSKVTVIFHHLNGAFPFNVTFLRF
jgi:hypothetical protein